MPCPTPKAPIVMGAPRWPPAPHRSSRPGGAVALLWFTWGPRDGPQPPIVRRAPAEPWRSSGLHGGPEMAPNPPSFVAPRRSRGAPLQRLGHEDDLAVGSGLQHGLLGGGGLGERELAADDGAQRAVGQAGG